MNDEEEENQVTQQPKEFLDMFSSEELRQLAMIAEFLKETYTCGFVACWTNSRGQYVEPEMVLSFGPDVVLQCYEEASTDPVSSILDEHNLHEAPLDAYLSHPLSRIWEERKVDGPPAGVYKTIILDAVHGENDRCCRCDTVHGVDLWNESNWSLLKGRVDLNDFLTRLTGRLLANRLEVMSLRNAVTSSSFSLSVFMDEIYDMKISAYDNWDKQDWLCYVCVMEIIQRHLYLWWLEQKRKAGQQIPEDCWYGYNCRTQTRRPEHAKKLNHLCEPSRGQP